MTEEEARQLRETYAAQFAEKDRRIAELESLLMAALLRIEELERRLGKDSHNSSKPPSSDGFKRKVREQRRKSEKKSGGQPGHPGHTLSVVATPDRVIIPRPARCETCQQGLDEVAGEVKERRQIHELPEMRLVVEEYQVKEVCCPACQSRTRGTFPIEVQASAQYGPRFQALAVYLSQFQLLPMDRDCAGIVRSVPLQPFRGNAAQLDCPCRESPATDPTTSQNVAAAKRTAARRRDRSAHQGNFALGACECHELAHLVFLAPQARPGGNGGYRNLATLSGTSDA